MTPWKPLPARLDPHERRLIGRLRALKDHSGLGLAALASRTSFSKSSWERYLNGKQLPPPEAVRELAGLCRADPDPLLALQLLAAEARNGGGIDAEAGQDAGPDAADTGADTEAEAEGDQAGAAAPPPSRRRMPSGRSLYAMCAGALSLLAVLAVGVRLSADTARPKGGVAPSPYVFVPGRTYDCDVRREEGRLHAGHSDTRDAVLQQITTSWDVVEAQCLLERHGYPVGGVDGAFGQATEKAVKRLQDDAGLVVDGIVGEHTWEVLRR
ncbi:peptidoglycan-binding protein [Streptomyces sp. TRM49041]|uniref:peptidoglycan-binding protein n=1 Tax=Streptomyces sp. TRM49041 TaxID=2603216 RepID=UPI0011EEDB04|nr:peptidoglycan-binding protein [Streptomyces sp. TRM49041]